MSTSATAGAPAPSAAAAPVPALCRGDLPLALLPVRLETRFFSLPGNVTELRVRVYPDKIHLDSHEPDLLPTERDWGTHYWEQDWRAGNNQTARAAAWRQLADRFGAERAAWIARVLAPANPQQRPAASVPANQPLPAAPQFPTVTVVADGRDAAWRHAPVARLMPDRWIAVLRAGAATISATGRSIVQPLPVGPDPALPAPNPAADQLAVDAGMKWMIDFDEAEAKGMALRLTVPPDALSAGLGRLIVFGVAASADGAAAATALAQLLDAHHYTDGLEFLRAGTPTNNTDDRRAAASSDDPGHARSFAIEVAANPASLDAQSNAVRVAAALGLPAALAAPVLGRVGLANDQHDLHGRSMNAALWQVGWGYFLTGMIGFDGTGLTAGLLAWARNHFVSYVRGFGPYPIVRCGRQPYGLLPVTSLDLWQPPAGQEQAQASDIWLRNMLVNLRDNIWRPRLTEAFRLGRRQSDPDSDLADVMRTDGLSSFYGTRSVFGRHYLQHLRAFMGEDLQANGFIGTQDALAAGLPQRLGIAWRPPLARAVAAETAWPITAPLVQTGEVSPWRNLEPNYIAALMAEKHIDGLINARPDPASAANTTSLLEMLLRHALLRELANAAAQILAGEPGADVGSLLRDVELVDLVAGAPPTLTWLHQLDRVVASVTGSGTIRQYLEGLAVYNTPATATLGDFRRSLAHLQRLDSETLQYLMQGTLDLSAHRLDAWITSFATKRLATMLAHGPRGVYVGAYGWVENLRPMPASAVTQVASPPAGEPGPLFARVNDSGFIHAPSLTHAAAAALLRNAHLGATNNPTADSPFAISLTSRRVREADRLLQGVRQGQKLGALLGYRFERALHDLGFDAVIPRMRALAPLDVPVLADSTTPMEAIAANNVVDGQVLARMWQDSPGHVRDHMQPSNPAATPLTPDQLTAIGRELDRLVDAIDGLSDALTAEAAYQMARGNTSRLASTLTSIAQGDAPPPELEVARMPRSGTAVTHRLLVLFSGAPAVSPGWLATDASIRASSEPMLNAWASKLLGDATKVRCTIERLGATGAVAETRKFPLSALQIAPLDLVYGAAADIGERPPSAGTPSEIEQYALYQARRVPGGFDPASNLRFQHARPADLAPGEITLFDVLEQARALRRLLALVRGAEPEDLNPPERAANGTIALPELEARVVRAEDQLQAAHTQLAALVGSAARTAENLRAAVLRLGGFGVGPAVPPSAAGESAAAIAGLVAQAGALLKTSASRLDRVRALRAVPASADPRARRTQLADRMGAVFGPSFVTLPSFSCTASAAAELKTALAASGQTQGGDALAANTWLLRQARVRDGVARARDCLCNAEILGTGDRPQLSVAQLPFTAGDRWVGLPRAAGKALPPGKLSLVLHTPAAVDTAQPLGGVLVDEWTEIVPDSRETTAITFQLDPPDAVAPQSVLLAVPPVAGADWTQDTLLHVLEETLDLAKLRAVDAETLGEAAQYLPALYLAFNARDHAVSTDFAPLTR
ncbi:MAG: hypothetical protein AB7H71_04555 [Alphaproteobacteria bacterium]